MKFTEIKLNEDDANFKKMKDLYGDKYNIKAISLKGCEDIDLTKLDDNQAVAFGDGKSYFFLLTIK